LKRFYDVRRFDQGDMKYVYADHILKGGGRVEKDIFNQYFFHTVRGINLIWSITKERDGEDRVVGLIFQTGEDRSMETHARWMHWATNRDVVSAAITFVEKMRRRQNLVAIVPKETDRFLEQLGRYGLGRRVGKILTYYPDKEDAFVWQSRE
jgi:hypothetical protein